MHSSPCRQQHLSFSCGFGNSNKQAHTHQGAQRNIQLCLTCGVIRGRKEKERLGSTIDARLNGFANQWCQGDTSSQEVLYLKALSALLVKGVAATEKLVSGLEIEKSSPVFGESSLQGRVGSVEFLGTPPLRLFDTYSNAFH